jgi:NDP-sugar pyrophosphorylase family protein
MKALILAGGVGTRMRPLTFSIPKPLIPFREKPIIEHAILSLRAHGIKEILISLGYMPELLRAYCRDGQHWGLKIEYLIEEKPLGTAGPIALAREKIGPDEDFIVMNGDVVTDLDFAALISFHKTRQFPMTMAYAEVVTKSPFGVVKVENGRLLDLREKPDTRQYVNSGI